MANRSSGLWTPSGAQRNIQGHRDDEGLTLSYLINGVDVEADEEGFLLEPDYSEAAVRAIAQAEGIELGDQHWLVIAYLRERYQEDGHTPNFRAMLKDFDQAHPGTDWKTRLYELFPNQPARQGPRVAGLPKPFGKGGY